jgi:tRNA(Ile)-lysidine synthase
MVMQERDVQSIIATITAFISTHALLPETGEPGELIVAVSGGADSLCLLHVLHRLCGPGKRYPLVRLHVAHLDHQLRPQVSRQEAETVAQLATTWGLPVTVGTIDVPTLARQERRSIEDAARTARYRFLRGVARGRPIAVAHHQDDQAETLLLHWLRGGGIESMIGLQPRQQDILRPLLCITHADTLAYCRYYGLTPLEDESNTDPHYLRNRIRHELIPLLTDLNPHARETLLRNAEVMQVDAAWIEEQVTAHWPAVVIARTESSYTLDVRRLHALPLSLQRHLLRRCASNLYAGQSPLELRHYKLIERLLAREQAGETRTLHMPDDLRFIHQGHMLTLRRGAETEVETDERIPSPAPAELPIPGQVEVPGTAWIARAELVPESVTTAVRAALAAHKMAEVWELLPVTPDCAYIDANSVGQSLRIRTWRPGDRIRPLGMVREKKVQDVLTDAHIPRAERATLPLFFAETHCIWLAGICLDDRVRLTRETQRIVRLSLLPKE